MQRTPDDEADAGDVAAAGGVAAAVVVVHLVAGEGRELEEGGAAVEQAGDAVAGEQLAALGELLGLAVRVVADALLGGAKLGDERELGLAVGLVGVGGGVDFGGEDGHGGPQRQRRTSGSWARWKPS
jgi:hypothetical protein